MTVEEVKPAWITIRQQAHGSIQSSIVAKLFQLLLLQVAVS
jgi:hypothetical protein